jgi:hypothetical protein
MTERPPGPRDWEPSDPDSKWWNPRPGDVYGPSDQEPRQPWERPPPAHRFAGDPVPGLPPAPVELAAAERMGTVPLATPPATERPRRPKSPWFELLRGLALLVAATVLVGGGVAVFIGSWRSVALVVVVAGIAAGIELAIMGAAAALWQTWPPEARPVLPRVAVSGMVVAALALAPTGLALLLWHQQWSPGGWLALAGIAFALVISAVTAAVRRRARVAVAAPGTPQPAQRATGAATVAGLLGWSVLLAGCGGLVAPAAVQQAFFHDPLADAGAPITAANAGIPTPSWSPPAADAAGDGGDPATRIRHDLESRVLISAGTPGPVTSECFHAFEQPEFVCTVTYQGLDVRFGVDTYVIAEDSYGYVAEAFETVLTEQGLHAQLREVFGDSWRLRCDELPAVELVRVDEQLEQRCYGKRSRFDRTEVITIVAREPGEPPIFERQVEDQ